MTHGLNIAFFGSSLVSAYWNGAATYYRGILKALHELGHRTTFYEPDAYDRQKHRDLTTDPDYAEVVVYSAEGAHALEQCLERARRADLVVKASGVGVFDELLEREVAALGSANRMTAFWDVDAPATLERVQSNPTDPFRTLIPRYDLILTYGGGPPVVKAYTALGARQCVPIYNALDPDTHHPEPPKPRFEGSLSFLGNRLPDREDRVHEFFFRPAMTLRDDKFLLGGSGWHENRPELANVDYVGHVYTGQHNAFNCTPKAVLNVSRESMARFGYSPATRVFEAAGAGACLITDAWEGIAEFFEPDEEILVAARGDDVVEHLRRLDAGECRRIGRNALRRVLADHTYARRAVQLDQLLRDRGCHAAAS